jgi:carboxyl-terminal processing protease
MSPIFSRDREGHARPDRDFPEGSDKPLTFNVIRDEISRKSVPDAIWVKPGIAYMFIESFNDTTSPEVEENLKRLGENNIKGLILDLRNNPGGLLNEGVAVSDRFLRKGQVVVSHHGRSRLRRLTLPAAATATTTSRSLSW